MHLHNKNIALIIIKIMTLYNAIMMGWNIKRKDNNTYELSKKMSKINNSDNFDLKLFAKNILSPYNTFTANFIDDTIVDISV